ncbi:MAG TPA: SurA N-terminal domain-containing protein [Thermoanaerobaculia bacterium]|nr:SurA N-terminal domain-containing protein [Thermoanaerobaculia bacterium]
MLKTMRDNLKSLSWVLWLVIAAFILLAFVGLGPMSGPSGTYAATVGGEEITQNELQRAYRGLEQQYRSMFGEQYSAEMAEQLGVYNQAMERLINNKVMLIEARRLGLRVSDEELREVVREDFSVDGRFVGQEQYRMALRNQGFTPASYEEARREDLLMSKMYQILLQNLYLSEADVEQAYREQVERATIDYLLLPQSRFGEQARASEQELERYLAEHPDEFRLPAQRRVAYLLVDRARMADEVEVPEERLRAYYEENSAEFEQPEQVEARHILLRTGDRSVEEARGEIERLRQRIAGGADFATVAREVSEDPGSAVRGGDLGFFSREQMVPEFAEPVFAAEEGELVGPVESPFGVHLVEVTGRRPAGRQPFEEVRDSIRATLAADELEEAVRRRAAEVVAELREGEPTVEAMRRVAEASPALEVQETRPFGLQEPVVGLGRVAAFNQAAFGLEPGRVSEPVEVPRGQAILLVQESLPERDATLADVEPQVRRQVELEKRQRLAREAMQAAAAEAKQSGDLAAAAAELGVEVQQAGPFAASGAVPGLGVVPDLTRQALSLDEGQIGGPVDTPQGPVLFQVTARQRMDPAQLATQRDQVREQLASQRGSQVLGALLQQRREELEVSYSPQVVDRLGATPTAVP